jgi:hypothetical protein
MGLSNDGDDLKAGSPSSEQTYTRRRYMNMRFAAILVFTLSTTACVDDPVTADRTSEATASHDVTAVTLHSTAEAQQLLISGRSSALDYFSPTARQDFVDSLVFRNGQIAGYKNTDLNLLPSEQRAEVLSLIGAVHPLIEGYQCTEESYCLSKFEFDCDFSTCGQG